MNFSTFGPHSCPSCLHLDLGHLAPSPRRSSGQLCYSGAMASCRPPGAPAPGSALPTPSPALREGGQDDSLQQGPRSSTEPALKNIAFLCLLAGARARLFSTLLGINIEYSVLPCFTKLWRPTDILGQKTLRVNREAGKEKPFAGA